MLLSPLEQCGHTGPVLQPEQGLASGWAGCCGEYLALGRNKQVEPSAAISPRLQDRLEHLWEQRQDGAGSTGHASALLTAAIYSLPKQTQCVKTKQMPHLDGF